MVSWLSTHKSIYFIGSFAAKLIKTDEIYLHFPLPSLSTPPPGQCAVIQFCRSAIIPIVSAVVKL
jgi:hypothetical protein